MAQKCRFSQDAAGEFVIQNDTLYYCANFSDSTTMGDDVEAQQGAADGEQGQARQQEGVPPPEGPWVVPRLVTMINASGTRSAPLVNLSLVNLTIRDAGEKHTPLSLSLLSFSQSPDDETRWF
jgi:hypothetical protein